MREYYIVIFIRKQMKQYTLWYSDEIDGFVLNDRNQIKTFTKEEEARQFANENHLYLKEEITELSCDIWNSLNRKRVDCNAVLTFWNIITDITKSTGEKFLGDSRSKEMNKIYDKLFYGCNLPVIRNNQRKYIPSWNKTERVLLEQVMKEGVRILSEKLEGNRIEPH